MLALVRQIMRFCGPYAKRIRLAWVFSFLRALCANAPLVVAVVLVNLIVEGGCTVATCLIAAATMVALLVLQSVFQHSADRLQSTAGYELFADKRLELAEHLRRLPMGYFSAGNMGKISSILSADMVYIEEHSMTILADVTSNVFAQVIITVFLFVLHPLIGAVALATELVAVAAAQPMNRESVRNSVKRQQAIETLTGSLLEYIEGLRIIKSFNRIGEGAADLRAGFAQMTRANLDFEEEHAPWERRLQIIYACGITALVSASVWLFGTGSVSLGSFIGILIFAFSVFAPIKALYQLDSQITLMQACLDRLQSVFDEKVIADEGTAALVSAADAQATGVPEIEFEQVSFAYDDTEVLHEVSFAADRGQTVALVGQSGSGKTTVASLLTRFWDVADGAVRVRGADVRDLPMESLMGSLSMVFQHVYLFEDTVRNNIAMSRQDATDEEIRETARKARCLDFVEKLPYGFDTIIGEGGASLSGGEAQRISIARCILKDSPIIVLDEATANIDADNESAIQQAMTELCRDKTAIVIAHRLNTVMNADKIVVLDAGRVAETGTPAELVAANGLFARMVATADATGVWSDSVEKGGSRE